MSRISQYEHIFIKYRVTSNYKGSLFHKLIQSGKMIDSISMSKRAIY